MGLLRFILSEKLYLRDYLPPHLKYTEIQSCILIESNQFINSHTVFGYLETTSLKSVELVRFKSKQKQNKQVFLISNDDCTVVEKDNIKNKTINNLLINNDKVLTIQRGRPYFFPKCENEDFVTQTELKY